MTEQRLTFLCWNCQHLYTLLREPIIGQKLAVKCPYCLQAGVVDLRRYPTNTITVIKGSGKHTFRTCSTTKRA